MSDDALDTRLKAAAGRDRDTTVETGVSRAVWKRDGERCAFVGPKGRCSETRFLELHHIHPYGYQGPATVENISVRCRAHNVYESELVFGPFVVRETREKYAVSGETRAVSKREMPSSTTSCPLTTTNGMSALYCHGSARLSFIYYGRVASPRTLNTPPVGA